MTGPVEERTYRWPRRYVFAVTLAVIIDAVRPVARGLSGAGRPRISSVGDRP